VYHFAAGIAGGLRRPSLEQRVRKLRRHAGRGLFGRTCDADPGIWNDGRRAQRRSLEASDRRVIFVLLSLEHTRTAIAISLVCLACTREPAPAAPPETPRAKILRFEASSIAVRAGEPVTLSWKTEHAAKNTIAVAGTEAILAESTAQAGFADSAPLQTDTVFTLAATSADGEAATAVTRVSIIAAPSELAILQFTASALSVRPGESITLSWEVVNASRLRLEAQNSTLLDTEDKFSGAISVSPAESTTYALTAEGDGEPKRETLAITVDTTPAGPTEPAPACNDLPRGPAVAWFEEVAGAMPRPIIPPGMTFFGSGGGVADFDRDGKLDLAIASRGAPVTILHNRGDLLFDEVAMRGGVDSRSPASGVALGDLDADGDTDLVLLGVQGTRLYENRGYATTFLRATSPVLEATLPAESALFADLDGDKRLEILLNVFGPDINGTDPEDRRDSLLRNTGGFLYEDVALIDRAMTWVSAWFDVDRDGQRDLYFANDTFSQDFGGGVRADTPLAPDALMMNRGRRGAIALNDETLAFGLETPHSSMNAVIADFDSDGLFDLYISNLGKNPLYLGQRSGPFLERSEELGVAGIRRNNPLCGELDPDCLLVSWGAVFEDFDNDGTAELLVANGGFRDPAQPPLLFARTQDAPARYEERDPGLGCFDGRVFLPADLDNDGDLDLVVIPRNEPVRVFRTHAPPENGWLRVRLEGRLSNREGRGSVITVELANGARMMRMIGEGGLVHSSRAPEAHFGLGAEEIAWLEVQWPSGQVQTLTGVARNQILEIIESQ
jgi:uncharacterized cupredoxin-like copper-binding protein